MLALAYSQDAANYQDLLAFFGTDVIL
jgi:hypothetical protein